MAAERRHRLGSRSGESRRELGQVLEGLAPAVKLVADLRLVEGLSLRLLNGLRDVVVDGTTQRALGERMDAAGIAQIRRTLTERWDNAQHLDPRVDDGGPQWKQALDWFESARVEATKAAGLRARIENLAGIAAQQVAAGGEVAVAVAGAAEAEARRAEAEAKQTEGRAAAAAKEAAAREVEAFNLVDRFAGVLATVLSEDAVLTPAGEVGERSESVGDDQLWAYALDLLPENDLQVSEEVRGAVRAGSLAAEVVSGAVDAGGGPAVDHLPGALEIVAGFGELSPGAQLRLASLVGVMLGSVSWGAGEVVPAVVAVWAGRFVMGGLPAGAPGAGDRAVLSGGVQRLQASLVQRLTALGQAGAVAPAGRSPQGTSPARALTGGAAEAIRQVVAAWVTPEGAVSGEPGRVQVAGPVGGAGPGGGYAVGAADLISVVRSVVREALVDQVGGSARGAAAREVLAEADGPLGGFRWDPVLTRVWQVRNAPAAERQKAVGYIVDRVERLFAQYHAAAGESSGAPAALRVADVSGHAVPVRRSGGGYWSRAAGALSRAFGSGAPLTARGEQVPGIEQGVPASVAQRLRAQLQELRLGDLRDQGASGAALRVAAYVAAQALTSGAAGRSLRAADRRALVQVREGLRTAVAADLTSQGQSRFEQGEAVELVRPAGLPAELGEMLAGLAPLAREMVVSASVGVIERLVGGVGEAALEVVVRRAAPERTAEAVILEAHQVLAKQWNDLLELREVATPDGPRPRPLRQVIVAAGLGHGGERAADASVDEFVRGVVEELARRFPRSADAQAMADAGSQPTRPTDSTQPTDSAQPTPNLSAGSTGSVDSTAPVVDSTRAGNERPVGDRRCGRGRSGRYRRRCSAGGCDARDLDVQPG